MRVLDCNGGPIPACTARVLRHDELERGGFDRLEGERDHTIAPRDLQDGFATLRGLPAGTFVLQVMADLHASGISAPFTLAAELPSPQVVVRLARGARIAGTVVDERGVPLVGAKVRVVIPWLGLDLLSRPPGDTDLFVPIVTPAETTTGRGGSFELAGLAGGSYRLCIEHADGCARQVSCTVTAGTLERLEPVVLRDGARVEGIVAQNGRPIADAVVAVLRPDGLGGGRGDFIAVVRTDREGRFSLPQRLPPGPYCMRAFAPGAWDGVERPLLIRRGKDTARIELDLGAPR